MTLEEYNEIIRLLGIPTSYLSASLYALAMHREVHPSSGPFLPIYFLASTPGTVCSIINYSARICDHRLQEQDQEQDQEQKQKKRRNQCLGYCAIAVASIQTGLNTVVYFGAWKLPPVISLSMTSLTLFFSEGLNWDSKNTWGESWEYNKGRYIGFFTGGVTIALSIVSALQPDVKALYFLTSTALDSFIGAGLKGRWDDIHRNGELWNKRMFKVYVSLLSLTAAINLLSIGLEVTNTKIILLNTEIDKPPIAFPNFMLLASLQFYLIAQAKLPVIRKMFGDVSDSIVATCTKANDSIRSSCNSVVATCTKASDSIRNCARSVRNLFSKAVSCCRSRPVSDVSTEVDQAPDSRQPVNSLVHVIDVTRVPILTSEKSSINGTGDTLPIHHSSILQLRSPSDYGSTDYFTEAQKSLGDYKHVVG